MDVILVFNGLGNQMSQYALYMRKKALHQKVRCLFMDTAHNGIELHQLFGIHTRPTLIDRLLKKLYTGLLYGKFNYYPVNAILAKLNIKLYIETDHSFQPQVLQESKGIVFQVGGWHHPHYFKPINCQVRDTFQFPAITDTQNQTILKESALLNAVAIHIRRGDFFEGENYRLYGKVCTEDYYRNAIRYMETNFVSHPRFFVFSNDMEWSKQFMEGRDCVFVDWNKGTDSWKDMCLMSQFRYIIIPNSTFSMWAAHLGRQDKVVCRPPYFVDQEVVKGFFPEEWIEISKQKLTDESL